MMPLNVKASSVMLLCMNVDKICKENKVMTHILYIYQSLRVEQPKMTMIGFHNYWTFDPNRKEHCVQQHYLLNTAITDCDECTPYIYVSISKKGHNSVTLGPGLTNIMTCRSTHHRELM